MKKTKITINMITLIVFGVIFLGIIALKVAAGKSWFFAHWYNDLFMGITFAMTISSIVNLICLKNTIKMQNRSFIYFLTSALTGICVYHWESGWYDMMDSIFINIELYIMLALVTSLICLSWCLIQEKSPYYKKKLDYYTVTHEDVDYSKASYEELTEVTNALVNMRFARIITLGDPEVSEMDYDLMEKFGNIDFETNRVYLLKDGEDAIGYFIATEYEDKQMGTTILIPEFHIVWHDGTGYGMMARSLIDYFAANEGKYIKIALPEREPHVDNMEVVINTYTNHNYTFEKEDGQLYIEFMSKSRFNAEEWI